MNLLFTTRLFAPHTGGAESMLDDLTRQLSRLGHQVGVVTSQSSPELPAVEHRDGVEVLRVAYPRQEIAGPVTAIRAMFGLLRLWLTLGSTLKSRKVEVVCAGVAGIDLIPVLAWRRWRRFRLVVYLHGGEIRSYVKVSRVMRWTLRRALRTCDAAISVSAALGREAVRFEPAVKRKLIVIPNAVDVAAFAAAEPYTHRRPYALFAGRLHPVKGLETLLEAFAVVARAIPDLDLLIAGDGPLAAQLRREVEALALSDRIRFLGPQSRSQVASLLRGCELAVLPSVAEACPLFVLEAQAAARVMLASRVKGNVEVIRDGVTGELVDPDDAAAWAERIAALVMDPEPRRRIEAALRLAPPADIAQAVNDHVRVYAGDTASLSVAVVSSFFDHDADNSGLSTYYLTLCRSLAELGHDVRLVTAAEHASAAAAEGLVVHGVPTALTQLVNGSPTRTIGGSARRSVAKMTFAWRAWREVRRIDRAIGLDAVIAPELFAPGLFVSLFMRRKLVTRVHTPTVFGDRYNDTTPAVYSRLATWPEKFQTSRSRAVSAASRHLIDSVAAEWKLPQSRITLLPNAIGIEATRALASRQPREIDGDYLLYFGRLERRKGVHVLTDALADVLARHPSLHAVCVGKDWGLKPAMLRSPAFATGRLTILDTMRQERLFGIIQHARLVVLPSLFENVSNAALESMALGRPVIGTRGTAFEELIEDGVTGWLVEPADARSLERAINACLERSDLEQIGARALERIRPYDGLAVARQQVAFLRRVASGDARTPAGRA